jgi:flagellar hook-associated protein 3 FlgL
MTNSVRITERSMTTQSLTGLQGNLGRLSELQRQLSSGKVLSRPSDNPTDAFAAMQSRSQMRTQEQYARNAQDGLGWLSTQDSSLSGGLEQIRAARDLVVQGMSTGSTGPDAQAALAAQVDSIRQSLLQMANSNYLGRPVFGGTTSGQVAYDPSGAYVGDANPVERRVGDNATIRVDTTGPAVFGTGGSQLFSILSDLTADFTTNPAALGADLTRLDDATRAMTAQLADVGSRYSRVMSMSQAADDRLLALTGQLSALEDIDLPKTITELTLQQTSYQAALSVTAKVLQPSLVDFLR